MIVKIFEDFEKSNDSYWVFEDEYLKIHKILHGANKGKILFRIFNPKENNFNDKFSMMYGAAIILGTKYTNYPQIREIKLGPIKFRKVQPNTIDAIISNFLKDLKHDDDVSTLWIEMFSKMKFKFEKYIKKIAEESIDLGEVFDGLKKVKDEIEIYTNVNKYNL